MPYPNTNTHISNIWNRACKRSSKESSGSFSSGTLAYTVRALPPAGPMGHPKHEEVMLELGKRAAGLTELAVSCYFMILDMYFIYCILISLDLASESLWADKMWPRLAKAQHIAHR